VLRIWQAAEARAAEASKISEVRNEEAKNEAEFPESSTLKEDTGIKGKAEFSKSTKLDECTDVVANAELPESITGFKGEGELPETNGSRDSFEVVNNSGEVIAEGFRLRKSKSLNLGSGTIADEPVRVRRVRSESHLRLLESDVEGVKSEADLRHREIGGNSPELSTLTITSADGGVVLHTPRRGSSPPLTSREDHIQTIQQPIILEGDGLEKPAVQGMLSCEQVVPENTQGDTPAEELNPSPDKKEVGAPITAGSGGWKVWPFPLRRPKAPEMNRSAPLISREASMVAVNTGVDSALVNNLVSEGDDYLRSQKNKVRSFLPTSQMLSSMNLKKGRNRITFKFFTRVLGKQQVRGINFISSIAF
jgi:phosphatidate phosphatase LPIN